ncbi:hypothetical protein D3C80_1647720 [compost metagenome]
MRFAGLELAKSCMVIQLKALSSYLPFETIAIAATAGIARVRPANTIYATFKQSRGRTQLGCCIHLICL